VYHHRRFPRSPLSVFASAVCLLLFVSMALSACNRSQRVDTIRTTLLAVNAARDGFTSWDSQHQQVIVGGATTRDAAQQALDAYRNERKPVADGFELAYRTLAVAATQTDDFSLKAALSTASDLIDKVTAMIGAK
jgi:hypothetical protein